jgi:TIR domain
MRVFISWSGNLSRQLGEAFRNWLPSALQYVKPYFTPADIDKGARWASEIANELSASSVCVIILTRDNLASSWIMFEAGAISSALDRSKVCPIIFDLAPTDVQGPLAQFQITRFAKADIEKLFNTINSAGGESKLDDATAKNVFEKWWPDLESEFNKILEGHTVTAGAEKLRSDRELIEEMLLLLRSEKNERSPGDPINAEILDQFIHILKLLIVESCDMRTLYPELAGLRQFIRYLPNNSDSAGLIRELDLVLSYMTVRGAGPRHVPVDIPSVAAVADVDPLK